MAFALRILLFSMQPWGAPNPTFDDGSASGASAELPSVQAVIELTTLLARRVGLDCEGLVLAYKLVERAVAAEAGLLQPCTIRLLLQTAIVLARKALHGGVVRLGPADVRSAALLPSDRAAALEVALLSRVGWVVAISPREFFAYASELRALRVQTELCVLGVSGGGRAPTTAAAPSRARARRRRRAHALVVAARPASSHYATPCASVAPSAAASSAGSRATSRRGSRSGTSSSQSPRLSRVEPDARRRQRRRRRLVWGRLLRLLLRHRRRRDVLAEPKPVGARPRRRIRKQRRRRRRRRRRAAGGARLGAARALEGMVEVEEGSFRSFWTSPPPARNEVAAATSRRRPAAAAAPAAEPAPHLRVRHRLAQTRRARFGGGRIVLGRAG